MPAAKVLPPSAVGGGSSKSTTSAKQFDGQLNEDACAVTAVGLGARGAAVFEVLQSHEPVGDDGVRSAALDIGDHGDAAGVRFVARVVQALGSGNAENSIGRTSAVRKIFGPGLQRPEMRLYQRSCGDYPPISVGTSGNPGRFRTTVQVIAAMTMTTTAGVGINGCPGRQRTRSHASSIGQADEQEDVVDDRGGEVAVQHVVRHPQAAAAGQFQPVSALNGHTGNRSRVVRIAQTDVGEPADENRAGAERAVKPSVAGGARCHRGEDVPPGRGPCR